jgi:DNA-binding LacI/PurR family transcriptional regulator
MIRSLPVVRLPQRLSLSVQTADNIRQAIADGIWTEYLPAERRLCEIFRVSRPTIRTALHLLAKDGLIDIQQGRRNRLLSASRRTTRNPGRLVVLVTAEPISQMGFTTYQGISEMRTHLAEQGFTTEFLVCMPGSARAQKRKLEEFIRHNRVLCCVLMFFGKDVQHWFADHSVPALVLGSCHPGVRLPSLDIDYRSVCRHAAGIFLGKGHRRLAFIVPDSGVAGDLASEQGFIEGVHQRADDDAVQAVVVRHGGTAQSISSKLDTLFNSNPPTALLVAKPLHVFIVLIYLLKRGLTVPDTVSFIARDHDVVFESVLPPIAHYAMPREAYAHRLSLLVLKMLSNCDLASKPNLIFPKYVAGGTVQQRQ